MKIERNKIRLFSIAEEGLLSSDSLGEGRLIPVIIIDFGEHQDIKDLLNAHLSIENGDVTVIWFQDLFNRKDFNLRLKFQKPMEITFGIRFSIKDDFAIIDGIIQSKGVYIQTGKKGDKVSKTLDNNKVLVEVPDTGIKKIWDSFLTKTLTKKYIKQGLSSHEAKITTLQHIKSMREFWKFRRTK